ncbi:forkhead box protein O1-like [Lethenteron reissneri]|uniref:forkhead box protein O1-like n=1 Tax=Lethenteron reissneri TaxID=7753 RepID=UPI002AB726C7|nr:forkhead box protein O1-like [Lethenteron reissneri]
MAEPPIDIDPEFEPLSRPRSCTWPLRRPDLSIKDGDPGQRGSDGAVEGVDGTEGTEEGIDGASPSGASLPCVGAGLKKGSSRRNAWGNLSYADLITSAIESAPEHRLTLAQIYEWMVRSVPYFRDKGDSNSSAGWKVSGERGLGG